MKLYNEKEVRKLFDSFAILIGEEDAVPTHTAVELFGEDAVRFTTKMRYTLNKRCLMIGYGIGQYTVFGLTLLGMKIAATYCNVLALKEHNTLKEVYDED